MRLPSSSRMPSLHCRLSGEPAVARYVAAAGRRGKRVLSRARVRGNLPPASRGLVGKGGLPRTAEMVESECGAVALGQACVFPPLSFGGALVARP